MAAVTSNAPAQSGPGARCPEAQADGVPCAVLGIDCEICGRAADSEHAPPHASPHAESPHTPPPHAQQLSGPPPPAQQPSATAQPETTTRRMHA
jgi:hypothetical protein